MSGGRYEYAFTHVENMAEVLKRDLRPDRRAFGLHLENIAEAMHAIEWVDSGDYAPDGDIEVIKACLSEDMIMDVLYKNALKAKKDLTSAIDEFKDRQRKRTKRIISENDLSEIL